MTARAIWKGTIQFEEIRVPVKLLSGVQDRRVHFRLLHKEDQVPVQQKMVHAATNDPLAPEEIRRGYEIEPGQFVTFTASELAEMEPEKSREIEITAFLDPIHIPHPFYDRLYYLAPDASGKSYALLAAALEKSGTSAVVRWNMRKKSYFGALQAAGGLLQLITLRYQNQVVDLSGLTRPEFRELETQERRMADQLVQALEDRFDPSQYKDQYREELLAMVQTKAKGGRIEAAPKERAKPQVLSLADMLKQSVQQVHRQRKAG